LIKKGAKKVTSDGTAIFRYDEGETVTNLELLKTSKTSFHASGAIHVGGNKIVGKSLRLLKEPLQLYTWYFLLIAQNTQELTSRKQMI
jgi:hypothetical protein